MSKVNWDDVKEIQFNSGGQKGEPTYAELKEGPNYFRVISDDIYATLMYFAWGRFQKSANDYGSDEDICPLGKLRDEKGNLQKARPYYLFKVIDRRAGKVKVLRVGRQVAQMMKTLANLEGLGPLLNYDICIQKAPKPTQPLYMVMPIPKALTDEDKELIANDTLDVEKLAKPAKVEWVQEFITKYAPPGAVSASASANKGPAGKPSNTKTATKPKPEPEVNNEFESSSDDLSSEFENL